MRLKKCLNAPGETDNTFVDVCGNVNERRLLRDSFVLSGVSVFHVDLWAAAAAAGYMPGKSQVPVVVERIRCFPADATCQAARAGRKWEFGATSDVDPDDLYSPDSKLQWKEGKKSGPVAGIKISISTSKSVRSSLDKNIRCIIDFWAISSLWDILLTLGGSRNLLIESHILLLASECTAKKKKNPQLFTLILLDRWDINSVA